MTTTGTSETTPSGPRIVGYGRPSLEIPKEWWRAGFGRQEKAIIGALVAAWTGLPFALWLAFAGFFFGAILGFVGTAGILSHLGILGDIFGGLASGLPGALLGAVLGTVGGFLLIYFYLVTHPLQLLGSLVVGALVSAIVFWLMNEAEQHLLALRGYRQPSRRERARIDPILLEVGTAMELPTVPDYWISESQKPGAWMHIGAFVLTRGLLGDYDESEEAPKPELDDASIAAILAHELNHWQTGDVVGLTMIKACFIPFVLITNAITWVRLRSEIAGIIGWAFLWPIWVSSRFVVTPLSAKASRQAEFEADARAASLGEKYRLGLRRALTTLQMWERPRTGWEEVMAATHPPTEIRLERLEAPQSADERAPSRTQASTHAPAPPKPSPAPTAGGLLGVSSRALGRALAEQAARQRTTVSPPDDSTQDNEGELPTSRKPTRKKTTKPDAKPRKRRAPTTTTARKRAATRPKSKKPSDAGMQWDMGISDSDDAPPSDDA